MTTTTETIYNISQVSTWAKKVDAITKPISQIIILIIAKLRLRVRDTRLLTKITRLLVKDTRLLVKITRLLAKITRLLVKDTRLLAKITRLLTKITQLLAKITRLQVGDAFLLKTESNLKFVCALLCFDVRLICYISLVTRHGMSLHNRVGSR